MKPDQTKVIFRKFNSGEVIALFPQMAGTMDAWTCLSYMAVGQHSSAAVSIVNNTKRASREEYAELAAELSRLGYKLAVAQRFTSADLAERKAQVSR